MKGAGLYLEVLGLALALCGLLILLAWGLRKLQGLGQAQSSGLIQIKASKPLGYKAQVVLLEVMGHNLLIGLGEGGPRLLCKLEDKDAAPGA